MLRAHNIKHFYKFIGYKLSSISYHINLAKGNLKVVPESVMDIFKVKNHTSDTCKFRPFFVVNSFIFFIKLAFNMKVNFYNNMKVNLYQSWNFDKYSKVKNFDIEWV